MLYALGTARPSVGEHTWIAPNASLIGDVRLGSEVSVWFNAVLRADNDVIAVGSGSNIQDGAVLHVDTGHPLHIGEYVTVGHKAMLHGCTIGDGCLIGMNAVVLNDAVIGRHCLIGANALITEGMQVPDGSLVLGSPAKVIKPVSDAMIEQMQAGARGYIEKIDLYSRQLQPLDTAQ